MYCFVSSTSLPILILLSILFCLIPSINSSPPAKSLSFSAPLIHRNSGLAARGSIRNGHVGLNAYRIRNGHVGLNAYAPPVVSHVPFAGLYYMKYKIGVPPIDTYCIPETGSEPIWFRPCTRCYRVLCTYTVCKSSEEYVHCVSSDTFCSGDVAATDSITLQGGIVTLLDMVVLVGCGHNNKEGLISLNRANLSLVTLLSFKQFSHRISTTQDLASIIGPETHTPLKLNPHPTGWYFANILGIRVGDKRLDIPPSVFGTRGTRTNFFRLVGHAAFDSLVEEIKFQMQVIGLNSIENPYYELCYADMEFAPKIMILFEGLDFELTVENTWDQVAPSQFCLTILGASDRSEFGMIVTRNVNVGYDLASNVLAISNALQGRSKSRLRRSRPKIRYRKSLPKSKSYRYKALSPRKNEAPYSG